MGIKAGDLVYTRLQVPDLDQSETFLVDFGLVPVRRERGRRFFRSTDATQYCYVIEEGPAHFLGMAFRAASLADLDLFAAQHDREIEEIDGPGGGLRVRVKEPNGYDVDVVFGIDEVPPLEIKRQMYNTGSAPLQRAGELFRLEKGRPTPLKRLAHVVLATPRVRETTDWFHENLGTISSDEIVAGPDRAHIGSFIRIDAGDDYVDHHTVFIIRGDQSGLHHISFEAQDFDAVLADHHYLKSLGRYEHVWGVGRHLLGSQVFDYWIDPFGYPHEHWADSDRINASAQTKTWDARDGMVTQWGEEAPMRFRSGGRP